MQLVGDVFNFDGELSPRLEDEPAYFQAIEISHHSASSNAFSHAFFGLNALKMFQTNNIQEAMIRTIQIELSKKMEKEPPLRISDCRKAISRVGPMIMARMKGAISYSSFLKT